MRNLKWMKKTAAVLMTAALMSGTAAWTGAGFVTEVQAAAPTIDMNQKGTLSVYKYDQDQKDKPLQGAGYSLYKVMSLDQDNSTSKYTYTPVPAFAEVLKGVTADALEGYSAQQIEALATKLEKVSKGNEPDHGEIKTDRTGKAEFTNLDLGYYLVVETTVPSGYMVTGNPFLVALPQTSADGSAWEYAVTAKPKNQNLSIDKKIDTTAKKENGISKDGTVSVGDYVPYQITTKIPGYDNPIFAANTVKFMITDVMSDGLKAVDDTAHPVKVMVGAEAAVKGQDYTLTINDAATGIIPDLTIEFTSDFLKGKGANQNVTVTYFAQVTDKAVAGMAGNTNKPYLDFTNKPGQDTGHVEGPKEVKVYTFDINVVKFTEEDGQKALEGANFELHKNAPDGDLVQTEKTSGTNGQLSFEKLDEGVYYLVETKAPNGYTLLANPIKVEIIANKNTDIATDGSFTLKINNEEITETTGRYISYKDETNGDSVVAVENHKGFSLPATGGMGIVLFLAVGITGIVVVSFLLTRKSKETK